MERRSTDPGLAPRYCSHFLFHGLDGPTTPPLLWAAHPQSTVCVHFQLLQSCPTLCYPMDCSPPGSTVHGDSTGMNAGVSYHALLQGIFPTQRSNPGLLCLLHSRAGSLPLAPPEKSQSHSVQFSSVAQSCPTLCDPRNRSTPGLPVHLQLPEFTQTHVH